jgi:deazaflavin-dependent oxidoreductase (nitroreductase family)
VRGAPRRLSFLSITSWQQLSRDLTNKIVKFRLDDRDGILSDDMDKTDLSKLAEQEYCYLTTKGRVSGKPHRIEIWFGTNGESLYLLSGGGDKSDWVKNLKVNSAVSLRIGRQTFEATGRIVNGGREDKLARELLATKYYRWREGKPLNDWARESLPIALDLKLT